MEAERARLEEELTAEREAGKLASERMQQQIALLSEALAKREEEEQQRRLRRQQLQERKRAQASLDNREGTEGTRAPGAVPR